MEATVEKLYLMALRGMLVTPLEVTGGKYGNSSTGIWELEYGNMIA